MSKKPPKWYIPEMKETWKEDKAEEREFRKVDKMIKRKDEKALSRWLKRWRKSGKFW